MQTQTHICLITDFCPGGELFLLLERQPRKVFSEEIARFFAAEIFIALEYLHCVGMVTSILGHSSFSYSRKEFLGLDNHNLFLLELVAVHVAMGNNYCNTSRLWGLVHE